MKIRFTLAVLCALLVVGFACGCSRYTKGENTDKTEASTTTVAETTDEVDAESAEDSAQPDTNPAGTEDVSEQVNTPTAEQTSGEVELDFSELE